MIPRGSILVIVWALACAGLPAWSCPTNWQAQIAAERQRAPVDLFARDALLDDDEVSLPALSPDGKRLAWVREQDGRRQLWWMKTADLKPLPLLAGTDAEAIFWSVDGRWLFLQSSRKLAALPVDEAGGSARVLARTARRATQRIVGVDRSQPAAILIIDQTGNGDGPSRSRLLMVTAEGKSTILFEHELPIADVALDASGGLVWVKLIEPQQHSIWRIRNQHSLRVTQCRRLQRCAFIDAPATEEAVLMWSDLDGDRTRVLRLSADGQTATLHEDPQQFSDLDDLVTEPLSGAPWFVSYRGNQQTLHGLNTEAQRHQHALVRLFPNRELSVQIGSGEDAFWLIGESAARLRHTHWHRYDPKSGSLQVLFPELPEPILSENVLAEKIPMQWQASDGRRLQGFVSVPPGRDPRHCALVVQVHGGPWSRSKPGYSGITQFLVNRGYVVFEPNFRGSTGFGRDYMLSARGDFGNGRVFQDIVEGTRFILSEGLGNPERVAISGASFGGYSALLGVTFAPDLFHVAIAAVPPSDFGWNLRWAVHSSDLASRPDVNLAEQFRSLDLDVEDDGLIERLRAQSPLANAGKLQRPLLVFAGGLDERVAIRSVTHYAASLRVAGKPLSLFIEPEAGHRAEERWTRKAYFYLLERMLYRYLGGSEPAPPDQDLAKKLRQNLRLDADQLLPSTELLDGLSSR